MTISTFSFVDSIQEVIRCFPRYKFFRGNLRMKSVDKFQAWPRAFTWRRWGRGWLRGLLAEGKQVKWWWFLQTFGIGEDQQTKIRKWKRKWKQQKNQVCRLQLKKVVLRWKFSQKIPRYFFEAPKRDPVSPCRIRFRGGVTSVRCRRKLGSMVTYT